MDTVTPPASVRYVIPVVRNTFQIINELAQSGALTLNDAAKRTGVPKSTVFRILATLQHLGVAVRDPEQKTYCLRRMLGELTRRALQRKACAGQPCLKCSSFGTCLARL